MSVVTKTVTQETQQIVGDAFIAYVSNAVQLWHRFLEFVERVPGGQLVLNYIKASHKNDPWRTLLEILLALVAIRYFLASKYSQDENEKVHLSEKEVQELIDDWQPEPLVPFVRKEERWELSSIPQVEGAITKHVNLEHPKTGQVIGNVLNMASRDYLDMGMNSVVRQRAIDTIKNCGVGACSPLNFYGTQDVHARLCEDLARFLGAENGIIYGQDFCTANSILPCFLKRGDIVIVDGGVNLSLQKGVLISRCHIEWYNHNDLDHLESILESMKEELNEGPLNRRFILTEALSENFGDSPDLKRLVEIKNKYKFRLALDESYSIGTLGANGRGLPEVYGIPRTQIEITMGTMAHAFGSSGGFCVGCNDMIYHQVLSSSAYVFSAAPPPYCATAVSTVINLLESSEKPGEVNQLVKPLQENSIYFHSLIKNSQKLNSVLILKSDKHSPVVHLRIKPELRRQLNLPESYGGPGSDVSKAIKNGHEDAFFDRDYNLESYVLQLIIDKLLDSKILLTRSKRVLHHELLPVVPELLIHLNVGFTKSELDHAFGAIEEAAYQLLSKLDLGSFHEISNTLEY